MRHGVINAVEINQSVYKSVHVFSFFKSSCLLLVRYVLVYFSILCMRYQAGIVTDEMLEIPKYYFILSGALEACGVASGMAAAGMYMCNVCINVCECLLC
mgnify:CR=1 FL=1